jgi:hypothetical protein
MTPTLLLLALSVPSAETIDLVVKETAGIRRFGYPVKVKLELKKALTDKEKFRLLAGGKPVAAQFRPAGKEAVWLDFNVGHAPLQSQAFRVEYGEDVKVAPEAKGGMSAKEVLGAFEVNAAGMRYVINSDVSRLFTGVRGGKLDYIPVGSKGLWMTTDRGRLAIRGLKGRVVREGPMACALEFTGKVGDQAVTVEMTFPRSKSWVEVNVTAPGAKAIGADLQLALSSPALVDFGAGTSVYVALKKGQSARMKGRPREVVVKGEEPRREWSTFVGPKGELKPYVLGTKKSPSPEGWAHAMDRERCVAVAVADFGASRDEIDVDADGGLRVTSTGAKGLRFWLHFVPMPVQVGAVTSPQAMLAPLVVEVKGR